MDKMRGMILSVFLGNLRELIAENPAKAIIEIDKHIARLKELDADSSDRKETKQTSENG